MDNSLYNYQSLHARRGTNEPIIDTIVFALISLSIFLIVTTFRHTTMCVGDGWQSMANAPRDGTVVELCNTYGRVPWYGLHRWTREVKSFDYGETIPVIQPGQSASVSIFFQPNDDPTHIIFLKNPTWVMEGTGLTVNDETSLQWRFPQGQ